jgi:hypothetical protein
VAFSASLAGSATYTPLAITMAGGVVFSASPLASSSLNFLASGGVGFGASISILATHLYLEPITASGGVSFGGAGSGAGFAVYGNDRIGTGGVGFTVSLGGRGLVLPRSGSSMTLIAAMVEYFEIYDTLNTELERRALQADFWHRWRIFPVRIL